MPDGGIARFKKTSRKFLPLSVAVHERDHASKEVFQGFMWVQRRFYPKSGEDVTVVVTEVDRKVVEGRGE
jgi:hypothetical protein